MQKAKEQILLFLLTMKILRGILADIAMILSIWLRGEKNELDKFGKTWFASRNIPPASLKTYGKQTSNMECDCCSPIESN